MNKASAIAAATSEARGVCAINVYKTFDEHSGEETYEYGPVGFPELFPLHLSDTTVIGTADMFGNYTESA